MKIERLREILEKELTLNQLIRLGGVEIPIEQWREALANRQEIRDAIAANKIRYAEEADMTIDILESRLDAMTVRMPDWMDELLTENKRG